MGAVNLDQKTWILVVLLAAVIGMAASIATNSLTSSAVGPPVGTIVAFYGPDDAIPDGWELCAGQPLPEMHSLPPGFDADSETPGQQLPDLTGRFLRGATGSLLEEGGSETHAHKWVRRGANQQLGTWYSYLDDMGAREVSVGSWNNGISNDGSGTYPFITDPGNTLFTSGANHLPPYTDLRFIIRIR